MEFADRHNLRDEDTLHQMQDVVTWLVGQRLLYLDLIEPNGLASTARPVAKLKALVNGSASQLEGRY